MKRGTFCISLDTELLWGRWDLDYHNFEPRAAKVRTIVKSLLATFDRYDIPATWAIVGNLYLKPNSKEKENKLWRAPDIIREIQNHKNQEIACHSFSHQEFTKLSALEAKADIVNCIKLAEKKKIILKSFVFPRNKINHLKTIKTAGFTCYRSPNKYTSGPIQLLDLVFPLPDNSAPITKHGLVAIPGHLYFPSRRGLKKYLPISLRVRRVKLGIDHASDKQGLFHLWFHPIDFVDNTEVMLKGLDQICQYASSKRKQESLNIKTMRQIASDFLIQQ